MIRGMQEKAAAAAAEQPVKKQSMLVRKMSSLKAVLQPAQLKQPTCHLQSLAASMPCTPRIWPLIFLPHLTQSCP